MESWCFYFYFNPFPILNDSCLQIVDLMDDAPYYSFLDACYTAKQELLITDMC